MGKYLKSCLVLASMACVLVACSDGGGNAKSEGKSPARVSLECERVGYPCTLAEVDQEVLERSDQLAGDTYALFAEGAQIEEVLDFLEAAPGMAEVVAGPETMYFRLDGGRPTWMVRPGATVFKPPAVPQPQPTEPFSGEQNQDVVHRQRNAPEPKRALILAPYFHERLANDNAYAARNVLRSTRGYERSTQFLVNDEVGLNAFMNWQDYDVVHLSTHGDIFCIGDDDVATRGIDADEVDQYAECTSILATGMSVPLDHELSYQLLSAPQGSTAAFDTSSNTMEADVPGCYKFRRTTHNEFVRDRGCNDYFWRYVGDPSNPEAIFNDETGASNCGTPADDEPDPDEDGEEESETFALHAQPGDLLTFESEVRGNPPADLDAALQTPGLAFMVLPKYLDASEAEGCVDGNCPATKRILLTPDFFAANYGGGGALENQIIYLGGCKSFANRAHFGGTVLGAANAVFGFDNVVETPDSGAIAQRLYQQLELGYTVEDAMERIDGQVSSRSETCDGHPVIGTLRYRAGKNLRVREVVEFVEPDGTHDPLPARLDIEDYVMEGQEQKLRLAVRLDGVLEEHGLNNYVIRLYVGQREVEGAWSPKSEQKQGNDDRYVVPLEFDLPGPVGTHSTLEARVRLPGGGQTVDKRELGGDCSQYTPQNAPPECACWWTGVASGEFSAAGSSDLLALEYNEQTQSYDELKIMHSTQQSDQVTFLTFKIDPPIVRGDSSSTSATLTPGSTMSGGNLSSSTYMQTPLEPLTLEIEENRRIQGEEAEEAIALAGRIRGPVARFDANESRDLMGSLDLKFRGLFWVSAPGLGLNCSRR